MTVLIVEHAPSSLRGYLSRWMLQMRPGVFVATLNARIREKIWEKINNYKKTIEAVLIYKSNTEQGFRVQTWGVMRYEVLDLDGYYLTKIPIIEKEKIC